jgi:tetratricopeptide (TPR) repeat protein
VLADRGEIEAALAMARRSCELAEQLGDVFSRSVSLTALAYVQLEADENEEALETIELADRLYREAMGVGGETEGWRATLRARALLGVGRKAEAEQEAEWAAETARRRGMNWQLPPALYTLARARAATGAPGVAEALDEAVEVAERLGHRMALRKIEADRESLTAAASRP